MLILGVNGWYERGHDATACIVQDGKLIAAVEEERLIRKKHSYDTMPWQSIAWCLNHCNIGINNIDAIAVGWDIALLYKRHGQDLPFHTNDQYLDILLPERYFNKRNRSIPVFFVNHHLAHAASAYYLSGFNEALVLVADGQGEDVATTIWKGANCSLEKLASFPIALSLGYFFEAVSSFIGFSTTHAGKTMGLAGYGDAPDLKFFKLTQGGYALNDNFKLIPDSAKLDEQSLLFDYWGGRLEKIFGVSNKRHYSFSKQRGVLVPDTQIGTREQNIAALTQYETERVLLHLIETYMRKAGTRNLCMAGGVALNCSCNGKIKLSGFVNDMFIQPASHDAGVAIGAALHVAGQHIKLPQQRMTYANIGPNYSDNEIAFILQNLGMKFEVLDDIPTATAELIADGNVIGWFQNGCEIGPRALGSRSILADPRTIESRDKTNNIKGREQWRPLSPSVLNEKSAWLHGKSVDSPFMLQGLPVVDEKRDNIAGIVHIDGTARSQTVTKELPRYHKMLSVFNALTGIPLVINTSFNGPGEPIVCTPYNALQCFFDRPLDALIMGNCLIKKR
tara:strand:- start:12739 stop:14430 length:1692 start_codon:yes stop_codon:yes gene_type:complete